MTAADEVAERYGRFALVETPGRSALYAEWARGVAQDASACAVIGRLPPDRRQPPLVFALARLRGAPKVGGYAAFADWLIQHADELVADASVRSLQTNEPQRSAVLLPALAAIEGPIALIELGASAGLCLLPDRYSYRYGGARSVALDPVDGPSSVVLSCELRGDRSPERRRPELLMPEIVWRAGLDLRPLDPSDADDRRFATALVWPGETGRAARIDAALDLAAAEHLRIDAGDATDPEALRRLVDSTPSGATAVVTTPGLLPHVPRAGRERLFDALAELRSAGVHWVSLDPPALHERWTTPVDASGWPGFVLSHNGRVLAAADPLGAWLEWRAS
ncbi:DUF2332 family protein [Microbacterium sp.]|jgi:hypothetical protein|uniref:DUF2332 family protein n=1 Tax=Microbacterium sp. TaxID=51671 RepID=UPI0037C8EB7F